MLKVLPSGKSVVGGYEKGVESLRVTRSRGSASLSGKACKFIRENASGRCIIRTRKKDD